MALSQSTTRRAPPGAVLFEAVIFIGIQGAGKTTFYLDRFFHTHLRLSLDTLRTRHRERLLVHACLDAKQSFVVDNTNVRRRERAWYIDAAHAAGFRVTGYYFQPELHASLARNDRRAGRARVPAKGIVGTYRRREVPVLAEGFDALFCVRLTAAHEYVVTPWPEPVPLHPARLS